MRPGSKKVIHPCEPPEKAKTRAPSLFLRQTAMLTLCTLTAAGRQRLAANRCLIMTCRCLMEFYFTREWGRGSRVLESRACTVRRCLSKVLLALDRVRGVFSVSNIPLRQCDQNSYCSYSTSSHSVSNKAWAGRASGAGRVSWSVVDTESVWKGEGESCDMGGRSGETRRGSAGLALAAALRPDGLVVRRPDALIARNRQLQSRLPFLVRVSGRSTSGICKSAAQCRTTPPKNLKISPLHGMDASLSTSVRPGAYERTA
jgi:hypothetical protein